MLPPAVAGQSLRLAVAGLLVGGGIALGVSRVIQAEYHGISGIDGTAFGGAAVKLGNALCAAFGPQHGMRGDKQYNMEESALFKSMRAVAPEFELWRDFHYEYEPRTRRAIDVTNGGPTLRQWVDDPAATVGEWDETLRRDEAEWIEERRQFLIYK